MALSIDGDLTIRHAARRREQLLTWLAEAGPDDALDVAGVAACDSSGLQLLLALRLSRARQGRGLVLCHAPPALAELLQRCGLDGTLPHA
ncbi:STAS domain-containing protein [uncultured Sphaerotilus sp.]|uniref:STAS domain-containing protein n=1 Tax=uncultured Sphaerotilus sp. TaxID=474984 RepID=UPI0030CA12FF